MPHSADALQKISYRNLKKNMINACSASSRSVFQAGKSRTAGTGIRRMKSRCKTPSSSGIGCFPPVCTGSHSLPARWWVGGGSRIWTYSRRNLLDSPSRPSFSWFPVLALLRIPRAPFPSQRWIHISSLLSTKSEIFLIVVTTYFVWENPQWCLWNRGNTFIGTFNSLCLTM